MGVVEVVLKVGELLGAFFRGRDTKGLFFVIVKVAGVAGSLALGDEVGLNLEQQQTQNYKHVFFLMSRLQNLG